MDYKVFKHLTKLCQYLYSAVEICTIGKEIYVFHSYLLMASMFKVWDNTYNCTHRQSPKDTVQTK